MQRLLVRLRALPEPARAWGLTSITTLYLLTQNDSQSPRLVKIDATPDFYRIGSLIADGRIPRFLDDECVTEDGAVALVVAAIQRSGGWPRS